MVVLLLAPPDGGAFAECFSGDYEICAFVLDLTRVGQGTTKAIPCCS